MSGEVTIRIPARRGGRRRGAAVGAPVAAGGPDAPQSPPPERIPRVARVLALAHHWRGLIRSGAVRDQADLARLVGVSRARVTQVMRLLRTAPEIQEWILCSTGGGSCTEASVSALAAQPLWDKQRHAFIRANGLAEGPGGALPKPGPASPASWSGARLAGRQGATAGYHQPVTNAGGQP